MKNEETNSLNEKEDTSEEEAQSKKGFAEGLRNLFKKNK